MGTRIYRASTETFDVELGPVFANFVLADEINRAPAKVQSALLEVMAEHQVSIGGVSHPGPTAVPRPRHAEPDRVRGRLSPPRSPARPLPDEDRDRLSRRRGGGRDRLSHGREPARAGEILDLEQLVALQDAADAIYVDRAVVDYAVTLVLATRDPAKFGLADIEPFISYGASPRASLGLIAAGRALALLRNRAYVLPQDVFDVAPDIIRHRLVLSYEALAQGTTTEDILARLLSTVPAPRIAPSQSQDHQAADRGRHAPAPASGQLPVAVRPPPARRPPASPADPPAPRPSRRQCRAASWTRVEAATAGPGRRRPCTPHDVVTVVPPTCRTRSTKTGPDEVLRRLDLMVNHKLDGMLHGEYQGLVPGHGSELGETRATRRATTSAASTGTSPPACRNPTCARPSPTGSSRPGS